MSLYQIDLVRALINKKKKATIVPLYHTEMYGDFDPPIKLLDW
jgi:hypothetical protein